MLFPIIKGPVKYTWDQGLGQLLALGLQSEQAAIAEEREVPFSLRIWALPNQRQKSQGRSPQSTCDQH